MQAALGPPALSLLAGFGYYSLFGGWLDAVLLLFFSAWRNRITIAGAVWEYIDRKTIHQWLFIFLPGVALGLIILEILHAILALTENGAKEWTTPVRPLLIPAKTTHRRTFPQKHDFAYSYLVVGIPVGWKGTHAGMISSDAERRSNSNSWPMSRLFSLLSRTRKGWFDIEPADYLERGNGHLGLRGKLDAYLRSQGADPTKYASAYLVTAARFLGYSFNPVSFWYLYSEDKELTAMILEVNNTFDERRMYFLPSEAGPAERRIAKGVDEAVKVKSPSNGDGESIVNRQSTSRMTKQWPKDFHVSPFNSRKGSYSLSAVDFFSGGAQGPYNLDTTITLKSSKDHPKLVARLFSSAPAIDPGRMSILQKLTFLCSWWWVGFVTFPRIVKEAAILFFRRSLHVWYRPEPLKQSIGRRADATERCLEPFFRDYLRYLVMLSPAAAEKKTENAEELEFKVLTPAFYTRFVHYAHDLEAVCCELQDNCTIWVSRPDLLPKLILRKPSPPLQTKNVQDFVYFTAIRALRQRPERIERPLTSSAPATTTLKAGQNGGAHVERVDIRDFRISSMDGFVLSQPDAQARSTYRSLVLRTFLADRLALGSVGLLDLLHIVLRTALAWVFTSVVGPARP